MSGKPGRDGEICLDLSQLAADMVTADGRVVRASAGYSAPSWPAMASNKQRTNGNRRGGRQ